MKRHDGSAFRSYGSLPPLADDRDGPLCDNHRNWQAVGHHSLRAIDHAVAQRRRAVEERS